MATSSNNRVISLAAFLETILPVPAHIPEELQRQFGKANPLASLAPVIAEYVGSNPFYFNPTDGDNFNLDSAIKRAFQERTLRHKTYESFTTAAQASPHSRIIPTCFPHLDTTSPLPAPMVNPIEHKILDQLNMNPAAPLRMRYIAPVYQGPMTFSTTGMIQLHDGSLLLSNELNLWLWPTYYEPGSHLQIRELEEFRHLVAPLVKPPMPEELSLLQYSYPAADLANTPGGTTRRKRQNRLIRGLLPAPILFASYDWRRNSFSNELPLPATWKQPDTAAAAAAAAASSRSKTRPNSRNKIRPGFDTSSSTSASGSQASDDDGAYDNSDDFSQEESSSGDNDSDESSDDQDHDDYGNSIPRYTCPAGHASYTAICAFPPLPHIALEDDVLFAQSRISSRSDRLFLTGCESGHITLHDGLTGLRRHVGYIRMPVFSLGVVPMRRHYSELSPSQLAQLEAHIYETYVPQLQQQVENSQRERTSHGLAPFPHPLPGAASTCSPIPRAGGFHPETDPTADPATAAATQAGMTVNALQDSDLLLYHDALRTYPLVISQDQCGVITVWDIVTATLVTAYIQGEDNSASTNNSQDQVPPPPAQDDSATTTNNSAVPLSSLAPANKYPYNYAAALSMPLQLIPLLPSQQYRHRIQSTARNPFRNLWAAQQQLPLNPHITSQTEELDLERQKIAAIRSPADLQTLLHHPAFNSPFAAYQQAPLPPSQLWSPFATFPFGKAHPSLNTGLLYQTQQPSQPGFVLTYAQERLWLQLGCPRDSAAVVAATTTTNPSDATAAATSTSPAPGSDAAVLADPAVQNYLPLSGDLTSLNRSSYSEPTILAAAYRKGQLTLCDFRCQGPAFYTFAHRQHVSAMTYACGLLWTGSWDTHIKSWDPRYLSTPVHTIQSFKRHVTALASLQDEFLIALGGDKSMKMYEINSLGINRTYLNLVFEDLNTWYADVQKAAAENRQSIYNMLPIYPAVTYTQEFQSWLLNRNLTYENGRIIPMEIVLSSTPSANMTPERVRQITNELATNSTESNSHHIEYCNMLTLRDNNGVASHVCRNAAQRINTALDACLFDWDIDDIAQHVTVVDDVVFTLHKECKTKVGINRHLGGLLAWVTELDLTEGGFMSAD